MKNNGFFFYEQSYNLKSPSVIVPFLVEKFNPSSVIDIGCGIGTWLKVFHDCGIEKFLGIDGEWVNENELYIEKKFFRRIDITGSFNIPDRFDLLICLEVAEHLKEENSNHLIKELTQLSNTIVFSAAIPGQGGQNHVNEQPPQYWLNIFKKFGFYLYEDFRDKFWNDSEIDWWYKQNMLVFKRKEEGESFNDVKLTYKIHHELWERELQQKNSIWRKLMDTNQGKISWRQLLKIIFRKLTNYHQKVNRDS